MSLEIQERWNKKLLLDHMKIFVVELKKWCDYRGLVADVPTEWPTKGSIAITCGLKKMEIIKILDPDSCDSFMKMHRVWGLTVEENTLGSKAFLARWPECWKSWDHRKAAWNDIDFRAFMERQLSEYFGVEISPISLPKKVGA